MPRKKNPFKLIGGIPAAPLGTWASVFGVHIDTLKRALSAEAEEWKGRDEFVSVISVAKALKAAKRQAEAELTRERAEALKLKTVRERQKLGELLPAEEVEAFFEERCQNLRSRLEDLAVDLAGRLEDPDAEHIVADYVRGQLLPGIGHNADVSHGTENI